MRARHLALVGVAVLAAAAGALAAHHYWRSSPDWFRARDVAKIPNGASGELIRYGKELIDDTGLKIGPGVADESLRYAGNNMTCGACHLYAGMKKFGLPLVGTFAIFPRYVDGKEITLEDRVNLCMTRSMNGKALPPDGREMAAFLAYIKFVGTGTPVGGEIEGAGVRPLDEPPLPPDTGRGETVYLDYCASCHGKEGEGQRRGPDPAAGYTVTPIWGPESFNAAAGMNRTATAAAFIRDNMPYDVTFRRPVLSVQQAWDVAAFVTSRARPPAPPGDTP